MRSYQRGVRMTFVVEEDDEGGMVGGYCELVPGLGLGSVEAELSCCGEGDSDEGYGEEERERS